MGVFQSKHAHDSTLADLMTRNERLFDRRDAYFREHLRTLTEQHEQQLECLQEDMDRRANAMSEQYLKKSWETQLEQHQAEMRKEMKGERGKYEGWMRVMERAMNEAHQRVEQLQAELERPIKNRQEKIRFVNSLMLHVHESGKILLAGPKGMGKSTFMWLLNRGEKPERSFSDGTVKMLQLDGFVDSIGLRGWTPEEIVKLMVLLVYDGIPRDLIIFGNDRIDLPVTSLSLFGIDNPMIVLLSADFWKCYNKNRIHLTETRKGARRVQPEDDLDLVYRLDLYKDIVQLGLGKPVTHHDDLEALFEERRKAGVRPFKFLLQKLGNVFTAQTDNDNTVEAIFRFIYIFEKMYNRDMLKFMNNATLQDFAALEQLAPMCEELIADPELETSVSFDAISEPATRGRFSNAPEISPSSMYLATCPLVPVAPVKQDGESGAGSESGRSVEEIIKTPHMPIMHAIEVPDIYQKSLRLIKYWIADVVLQTMKRCHDRKIVGLDFQPHKVFFTDNVLRLSQRFDAKTNGNHIKHHHQEAVRTLLYLAPECLSGMGSEDATAVQKADVWGWACLLLYIFTENDPQYYRPDRNGEKHLLNTDKNAYVAITLNVGDGTSVPRYEEYCSNNPFLESLFRECFQYEASMRPDTTELSTKLDLARSFNPQTE